MSWQPQWDKMGLPPCSPHLSLLLSLFQFSLQPAQRTLGAPAMHALLWGPQGGQTGTLTLPLTAGDYRSHLGGLQILNWLCGFLFLPFEAESLKASNLELAV